MAKIAIFLAPPRRDLVFVLDSTGVILGGYTKIVLHVNHVSEHASKVFGHSRSLNTHGIEKPVTYVVRAGEPTVITFVVTSLVPIRSLISIHSHESFRTGVLGNFAHTGTTGSFLQCSLKGK